MLRIDDTDDTRSKPEFETAILEDLAWLGLDAMIFSPASPTAPTHYRRRPKS